VVDVGLNLVERPLHSDAIAPRQSSLFASGSLGFSDQPWDRVQLDAGSPVDFCSGWLQGSDTIFDRLAVETGWFAAERPMYDRIVQVPRLISVIELNQLTPTHPPEPHRTRAG